MSFSLVLGSQGRQGPDKTYLSLWFFCPAERLSKNRHLVVIE